MSKIQKSFYFLGCIVTFFCIVIGCNSSSLKRYQVSGTVTLDGQPVAEGEIRFSPDNAKGNTGPQGYAAIENGKFKTLKETGVIVGPMYATVTAVEPIQGEEKNDGSSSRKIIFENWNYAFEMPAKPYVLDLNITKEDLKELENSY
ncbi:MAG: DUF4198 domain-containing protein [Planctomycetaceae bacterium]|jgi:hypothetical protein|nr:DUF4198 domain-containing protein [Planctomycetaceae bacterium]